MLFHRGLDQDAQPLAAGGSIGEPGLNFLQPVSDLRAPGCRVKSPDERFRRSLDHFDAPATITPLEREIELDQDERQDFDRGGRRQLGGGPQVMRNTVGVRHLEAELAGGLLDQFGGSVEVFPTHIKRFLQASRRSLPQEGRQFLLPEGDQGAQPGRRGFRAKVESIPHGDHAGVARGDECLGQFEQRSFPRLEIDGSRRVDPPIQQQRYVSRRLDPSADCAEIDLLPGHRQRLRQCLAKAGASLQRRLGRLTADRACHGDPDQRSGDQQPATSHRVGLPGQLKAASDSPRWARSPLVGLPSGRALASAGGWTGRDVLGERCSMAGVRTGATTVVRVRGREIAVRDR